MAEYFARVELFGADGEKYETLHEKMESIGFLRTVMYSDGKSQALPSGSYAGVKTSDLNQIREQISGVADPLSSKNASVFVCKLDGWAAYLYSAS